MTAGDATSEVPRGAGMSWAEMLGAVDSSETRLLRGTTTYPDRDRATLAALLGRDGVRHTEVGTPVASPDGNHAQLGDDDGCADSRSDFLGGLDPQADVALRVANDDNGLEARSLTGAGLLLDRLDLFGGEQVRAEHRGGGG